MRIVIADHAGFCFGVKRAIDMAENNASGGRLVTLGPLIHNRQETNRLGALGIRTCDGAELPKPNGDEDTVIIRSHGVGPQVIKRLNEENWRIIDATCPYVARAQSLAQKAFQEERQVIILGNKEHPEVKAIKEWTDNTAIVVASVKDLQDTKLADRVTVLAQTTEKEKRFEEIVAFLQEKVPEVEVFNTICKATKERQEAAAKLAGQVDVMIIVGGRHSSNTNKLWEICKEKNPNSFLVETPEEMDQVWFKNKYTVGMTAGASTPAWIIKEVVERMQDYADLQKENTVQTEEVNEEVNEEVREEETVEEDNTTEETNEQVEEETVDETQKLQAEEGSEAERQDISDIEEQLDFRNFQTGEIVNGTVVKVSSDEVLVDIGGKSEGIIPAGELSYRRVDPQEFVSVGQEISVEIVKESKEGNIILSHKMAMLEETLNKLEKAFENKEIIEASVIEVVKGGLLVDVGIRGFMPASQVDRKYVEDLSQFVGQNLRMKVLELDREKKKAVLSQKVVLEEEYQQKAEEIWDEIKEGETRKGIVRRLAGFGAFVDIGGIDGLLHISEMSWQRIETPSEVLNEGDEIEVLIIKVDREKKKLSLSLKELLKSPWDNALERLSPEMVVPGKVKRLASFGAFIEVEPGVEGLAHISQLSVNRVNKVEDVLQVGQEVDVKILDIDPVKKRISLSLKDVATDKENAAMKSYLDHQDNEDSGVTIGDILRENNGEL